MEGTEMSPSLNSEESSVLDLPSLCDPAELLVPPCGTENTEELYRSVDAFPSLPTALSSSGEPSVIQPESNHHNISARQWDWLGESNLSSAVPAGFSAEGSEKGNVRCCPKAGLCEPTGPDDAVLSWMHERDSAEDPSVRKSLDDFYEMYCRKQPGRTDPTYEAASRCLSQKISELANRDGTKYASRCLRMAQLVLNRDGGKIFPNHPPSACFSKPAEGGVLLEDRKRTPGLSDDILQFLLKQTQAEHSPDVSQEK